MRGKIVQRLFHRLAPTERLELPCAQAGFQGVGMVVVDRGGVLHGHARQVVIVGVMLEQQDARIPETFDQTPAERGLSRTAAAGHADDETAVRGSGTAVVHCASIRKLRVFL